MAKKKPAAQQQAERTETEQEAAEETKEEGSRCWICEKTECLCPEVVRSYASKEEYRAKVTATAADDTQGSGEHSLVWLRVTQVGGQLLGTCRICAEYAAPSLQPRNELGRGKYNFSKEKCDMGVLTSRHVQKANGDRARGLVRWRAAVAGKEKQTTLATFVEEWDGKVAQQGGRPNLKVPTPLYILRRRIPTQRHRGRMLHDPLT